MIVIHSDGTVLGYPTKSQEEIEALKNDWLKDSIWDIEETHGFEAHYDELLEFRLSQQAIWKKEYEVETNRIDSELNSDADSLGSRGLYRIILDLTERVSRLENILDLNGIMLPHGYPELNDHNHRISLSQKCGYEKLIAELKSKSSPSDSGPSTENNPTVIRHFEK